MPVCYKSQEWLQRDENSTIARAASEIAINNDNPEEDTALVFGRENDLLKLECMLLEGGRPVLVVGEPGIGKSVLLAVLAQWWSSTGCAVATHAFQLSQDKSFTVDKMCRDIHTTFKCPGPYNGRQSIVPFLRATRFLIVIDSLESMTVEASTTVGRQRVALKEFIKALHGGKTVLVLSSRQEAGILSPFTSSFPLSGLTTIPAMHLMRALLKLQRKSVTNLPSIDSATLHARITSTLGIDMASEDSSDLSEHIEALRQESKSGLESLYATWDTDEDGIYLEEIHKLVNGHPLALGLLTINMSILGPEVTPKRFMHALLQGAPVILNRKVLIQENGEEIEGIRSLDDLDRMISDLQTDMPFAFKHTLGLLATFWKVIPTQGLRLFQKFQFKESVISGDKNAEVIATVNNLESAGLCQNISPSLKESFLKTGTGVFDTLQEKQVQLEFYEYLEAEGLLEKFPEMKPILKAMRDTLSQNPSFEAAGIELNEAISSHEGAFMFTGMRDIVLEKFEGLDEEARGTIRSWESWEDCMAALAGDGPATGLHHLVTSARSSLVQPGLKALVDSRLLEIPRSDQATKTEAGMQYIKTSPLLTIMLRGQFSWSEDKEFVASHKVALALFYAHRCQTWPPVFPATRTAAWNATKSEADIEFYNLASAAAICKDQLSDTNRSFIVEGAMMDAVLGLEWCSMADNASAPIVQMLWEQSLDEAQETVKALENSGKRPQRKKWFGPILSQPAEKDVSLPQREAELRLFGRRMASILLALGLLRFYNRFDDSRTRRCSDIIKSTARNIKKDTYPLELIQKVLASKAWIISLSTSIAESSVSKWSFRRKRTAQELQAEAEKQWRSTSTADVGGETTANGADADARRRLDPQTYSAVATQFQEYIQEIHRQLSSGNHDAARELLDAAFEEELEYGQNDPGRRAALLFFSSVVSAKQGRLSDALRDLEESRRLSSMPGQSSGLMSMDTITSFMRRSLVWVLKMESKMEVHQNTRLEPCACCYKERGTRRCLGCLYTLYCSADCQKRHWTEHKKVCKRFGSGYSI
ncbi:MAG: hypothetical protein LQ346_000258 [Caloplaca aetnensis]|nr:MAG: hypothetical protein LQ346_000258 [Caloplaca aetnensis]